MVTEVVVEWKGRVWRITKPVGFWQKDRRTGSDVEAGREPVWEALKRHPSTMPSGLRAAWRERESVG